MQDEQVGISNELIANRNPVRSARVSQWTEGSGFCCSFVFFFLFFFFCFFLKTAWDERRGKLDATVYQLTSSHVSFSSSSGYKVIIKTTASAE